MAALLRPSMFMLLSTFTLALNSLFSKLLTEYFSDAILVMLRLLLPALVMLFIAACSSLGGIYLTCHFYCQLPRLFYVGLKSLNVN
ncbi:MULTISPECIES: hypothetical protein [unclassified Pseudoalteromonas]|uniref:hypothetical protein n=1 Tax=unclassified Pseudoalteromonas TaxID=194690 RepID=UPI00217585D0|nr:MULTISPECIES: hypothetical protein [unclassified Pseudoalteromonas]